MPDEQEKQDDAEKSAGAEESSAGSSGGGESTSQQKDLDRPSAEDIYQQVASSAKEELKRSSMSLAISGVAGGLFMGLSVLGTGLVLSLLGTGPGATIISRMFYPLGFIVVIIGRSQLFTENTLYPVALVLAERRQLWNTVRLWATVLPSNVVGALLFALLAAKTHALPGAALASISLLGTEAARVPAETIFWSGVMGGWIIATAAWLVSASHSVTGSVAIIWLLTFVVGLGNFAHCIAGSGEVLSAVLHGALPWSAYPHWLALAVAGNVCGGIVMVTLLEYGQAVLGKTLAEETEGAR